jgi:hypothetical protein
MGSKGTLLEKKAKSSEEFKTEAQNKQRLSKDLGKHGIHLKTCSKLHKTTLQAKKRVSSGPIKMHITKMSVAKPMRVPLNKYQTIYFITQHKNECGHTHESAPRQVSDHLLHQEQHKNECGDAHESATQQV